MGHLPDQKRATSLIRDGLRQLRAGKVSAALTCWEEALALDYENAVARSYIDYIKKNRIRIAVHLGRAPPLDNEPINIPESWPEPPVGLRDPIPSDDQTDADATRDDSERPARPRPVAKSSGSLPYAEIELTGASSPRLSEVLAKGKTAPVAATAPVATSKAPPAPRPPEPTTNSQEIPGRRMPAGSPTGDDYLALEIVLEEDEPPADPRTLPPPPEALTAPEMIIEAPKQDAVEDEPQDYLYDRASSEQLESLSLDHLAGKGEVESTPSPAPPAAAPDPGPPQEVPDDAATQARDHTPSGIALPAAEPARPAADGSSPLAPLSPRMATTFDEVDTNPRSDPQAFSRLPRGGTGAPSPYTTLAGLGPRVLFAEFGDKDLQGAPPPLDFSLPAGGDPAPGVPGSFSEDGPPRARGSVAKPADMRMDAQLDFDREEESFSDDIPTQARRSSSSAVPQRPGSAPEDFDREQGSFSDDLPTQARPATVQAGSGVVAEPKDFDLAHDAFADDAPTTARQGKGLDAGIRAMPLDHEFRREGSFSEDLATLERRGHKEERLSEEMEALLHPDRGLAMALQLFDTGEHMRSLQLVEQLQRRYPTLVGITDLLESNRTALEGSLLEKLGDLDAIPVPRAVELIRENRDLDPRAAFLFSRIDGTLSLQDILDVSGMSQFEAARLLLRLREIGLLDFEPPR